MATAIYFVDSAYDVRCYETEIVWITESLTLTQNPHSVVFLEENVRLYTGYCATVSLSLFSASANEYYLIHLVYSGYHENVPVNFMTNSLKWGVPVSKPLLEVIWQENISDLFASLAIRLHV